MNTKMYVGNLSFDTNDHDLRELFSSHGAITEIALPMDRDTGRPRGFAFVTMETAEGMNSCINALNGKSWQGRPLTINEARPREERAGGYAGGGGGNKRAYGNDGGNRY